MLISIHLMFLLITKSSFTAFPRTDFNTSHVSINQKLLTLSLKVHPHFNTSHVSINRGLMYGAADLLRNFNTSHVSINLCRLIAPCSACSISIHLMFLLISVSL